MVFIIDKYITIIIILICHYYLKLCLFIIDVSWCLVHYMVLLTNRLYVFIQQEHYFDPKCFAVLLWLLPVHYGHNGPTEGHNGSVKAIIDRSIMAFLKKNEGYLKLKLTG